MYRLLNHRNAFVAWLALIIGALQLVACAQSDLDFSRELPRIKPLDPDQALRSFEVADGFEVSLVASEPLIESPVAIAWDESGAMYVCEMRGYSERQDERISRVRRLTDTDSDGTYDSATDFVVGLAWPTGLFPYEGGLFIADAPDLWYCKDIDGDGKADLKRKVLTGFGTSNVQGLMNSFRWGLDNRIHIATSSNGGKLEQILAPKSDAIDIRGRDVALDPRTGTVQLTSGAAQHGMCFDDFGNKFVSSNSDHIQQVMYEDRYVASNPYFVPPPSRVSIAEDGPQAEVFRVSPVEPWRIVRTRLRVSGTFPGLIEGGGRAAGYFTGATGITILRGDAWDDTMRGVAVVGDVGGNLVHRKLLTRHHNLWKAKRIDSGSEWIASRDIWFRPVQFENAPDGTLYIIDMYREVIEHPHSLPEPIKRHLDLSSGMERGRVYRVAPAGYQPRTKFALRQINYVALCGLLEHKNAWHRETASRLIFERQDRSIVPTLERMVAESNDLGRLHAMYALQGLRALSNKVLMHALNDSNEFIRQHAVRLSEEVVLTPEHSDALGVIAKDPSPIVRKQLAFSLGKLTLDNRESLLAELAIEYFDDPWIVAAVLCSAHHAPERVLEIIAREADKRLATLQESLQNMILAKQKNPRDESSKPLAISATRSTPRSADTIATREAVIAQYRDSSELAGDAESGEQVFKSNCAACHRIGSVGHELGPNLVTVLARGREAFLAAVLDPNREVNPLYVSVQVLKKDDSIISGMVVDEGSSSITLSKGSGVREPILKIEIDSIQSTGKSLMPEGFEKQISKQQMADLIEYLQHQ